MECVVLGVRPATGAIAAGKVLQRNITFNGYSTPTPVQQYAVPISIAGRDIMACAQTGERAAA